MTQPTLANLIEELHKTRQSHVQILEYLQQEVNERTLLLIKALDLLEDIQPKETVLDRDWLMSLQDFKDRAAKAINAS